MNSRILKCNKEVLAIGQEGSIADNKEKLLICFNCYKFILCKHSQEYLKGIINQQNNLISINPQVKL
jgi:hypothetical protein